ncbi:MULTISPECIES: RDD family protein [Streptomycetaceae]|uniref:RDD domain-containing protein n=1 Tax=Streptantibioticus cattleyicolor (strain ATCC 35852 / DSM 46488 / JCM 4925 / NBRC 14057 / NRRL 8057) TaxID=1003195 RepID=F8JUA5_STREN|nr:MULTISPECIES: RDD family protein [Streptomycetaceae]AEW94314.1 hypothetical protein SCATT_19430 [Streptantibioticus cattleyicolor NRRL 8057 = DSM 46488]MYS58969.1 RDD family protein [Streptomyces sp. SID5468]CCB74671.1 conserved protein of unknown function [Streptantibioticus cattleyicolor NRRL 8057 = DSM 46488]
MSTDPPTPGPGEPPEEPSRKYPDAAGAPEGGGTEGGPYGGPHGMPPPAPPYGTPYGTGTDPLLGMPPLAARWRRLVARIADALIVGIPIGIILGFAWGGYDYNDTNRSFWQELIYALVYFGYDGYMLTTRGQTLGKRWMRIRVAMLDSGTNPAGRPGWVRAAVYALPPVVPCCGSVFWLVNVAWCLWDQPYHHALHDKAARTVVVSVP